jgi:cytosine/adenosine deaminase-related metal-dependent hydrolase
MTTISTSRRTALLGGAAAFAAAAIAPRTSFAQIRTAQPTLYRGATIVTMDSADGGVLQGDLLVRDGRIAAVGGTIPADGAAIIDAEGMILIPGLINSHIHLGQAIIRGLSSDHTLGQYFQVVVGRYSPKLTAEDLAASDYAGALEQLDNGTTTIFDWSREVLTPAHADAAIDAMRRAGIRAFLGYAIPGAAQGAEGVKADIKRVLAGPLAARDGRVRLAAGVRGPDSSSVEDVLSDFRFVQELGLLHQFHIGAWLYPARRARGTAQLAADKLLTRQSILVHANSLDEDEYKLVADNGASIVITPEVEMMMGHGQPATGRVLRNGGRPGLGVDVVTGTGGDMFTQMRMAIAAQRLADNLAAESKKEPLKAVTLTTRQALAAATIDGARLMGIERETGSLTVGKRADIAMIRARGLATAPGHDPISTVVMQANASSVDTVMVDGEIIKRNGQFVGRDIAKAAADLQRQAGELLKR